MAETCLRSMACKCPECLEAMGMVTASDLRGVASSSVFDEVSAEEGAEQTSTEEDSADVPRAAVAQSPIKPSPIIATPQVVVEIVCPSTPPLPASASTLHVPPMTPPLALAPTQPTEKSPSLNAAPTTTSVVPPVPNSPVSAPVPTSVPAVEKLTVQTEESVTSDAGGEVKCLGNMACRCPACMGDMGLVSASDLRDVAPSSVFDEATAEDTSAEEESLQSTDAVVSVKQNPEVAPAMPAAVVEPEVSQSTTAVDTPSTPPLRASVSTQSVPPMTPPLELAPASAPVPDVEPVPVPVVSPAPSTVAVPAVVPVPVSVAEEGKCLRSMACRCPECMSAMGMVSASDLRDVSSSSVFDEDLTTETVEDASAEDVVEPTEATTSVARSPEPAPKAAAVIEPTDDGPTAAATPPSTLPLPQTTSAQETAPEAAPVPVVAPTPAATRMHVITSAPAPAPVPVAVPAPVVARTPVEAATAPVLAPVPAQNAGEKAKCLRSMACRCPECMSAMGMVSASDLRDASSSSVFDEDSTTKAVEDASAEDALEPTKATTSVARSPEPAPNAAAVIEPTDDEPTAAATHPSTPPLPHTTSAQETPREGAPIPVVAPTPAATPMHVITSAPAPPAPAVPAAVPAPVVARTPIAAAAVAPVLAPVPAQNAGEEAKCLRSMACRCPECMSAMGMVSASDLRSVSSSSVFEDDSAKSTQSVSAVQTSNDPTTVSSATVAKPVAALANASAPPPLGQTQAPTQSAAASSSVPVAVAAAPVSEEASELSNVPLLTRLGSGDWKARRHGYDELRDLLQSKIDNPDSTSPVLDSFMSNDHRALAHKMVAKEKNVSALDSALAALTTYTLLPTELQGNDPKDCEWIERAAELCLKCLDSRPSTKLKASSLFIELIAVGYGAPESCFTALVRTLNAKSPKLQTGCLSAVRAACEAFGARSLPTKLVLESAGKGLGSRAPAVRKEAINVLRDVHLWFGEAMLPLLLDCATTEPQRKELEHTLTKPQEEPPAPTRTLRSDTVKAGAGAAGRAGGGDAVAAFDVFDMLETNEIISKLVGLNFEKRVQATKWADRKGAIAEVEALCGTPPKLDPAGDYHELVHALRVVVQRDANQAVVVQAINLMSTLGAGLRTAFVTFARSLISIVLPRYKDKKAPLRIAVDRCLDTFVRHCVSFTDEKVLVVVEENMVASNPAHHRLTTAIWLARALSDTESRQRAAKAEGLQPAFDQMASMSKDPDAKTRDAAAACLGAMIRLSEEDKLDAKAATYLQSIVEMIAKDNPLVHAKIVKHASGSKASAPVTSKAKRPAAAAAVKKDVVQAASGAGLTRAVKPVRRGPPIKKRGGGSSSGKSSPVGMSVNTSAATVAVAAVAVGGSSSSSDNQVVPSAQLMDADTAHNVISEEIPIDGFAEQYALYKATAKWQERQAFFVYLKEQLSKTPDLLKSSESNDACRPDAVISFLGAESKDFGESNFNVMNAVWECATAVCTLAVDPVLGAPYAVALVEASFAKVGDRKQAGSVTELWNTIAELHGPFVVVSTLMGQLDGSNNHFGAGGKPFRRPPPKITQEIFTWIGICADDFGVASINPASVLSLVSGQYGLGAKDLPTKKAATSLVVKLYSLAGAPVKSAIGGAMTSSLEAELNKVKPVSQPAGPKRQVRADPSSAANVNGSIGAGAAGGSGMGDMFPRTDVSALITTETLEEMGDVASKNSWRARSNAMDATMAMLEASGKRIQTTARVRDLATELRKRLSDSNRNLAAKAANCLGLLAECVGADGAAVIGKNVNGQLMSYLGDSKKNVVASCLAALTKIVVHDAEPAMAPTLVYVQSLPEHLVNDKIDRAGMLSLFIKSGSTALSGDTHEDVLLQLVPSLLNCLKSRDAKVRKAAGKALGVIQAQVGVAVALEACCNAARDLKPAVARAVDALFRTALTDAAAAQDQIAPENEVDASALVPGQAHSKVQSTAAKAPVSKPKTDAAGAVSIQVGGSAASPAVAAAVEQSAEETNDKAAKPWLRKQQMQPTSGATSPTRSVASRTVTPATSPARHASASASATAIAAAAISKAGISLADGCDFVDPPPSKNRRLEKQERKRSKRWPAGVHDEKNKSGMALITGWLEQDLEKVVSAELLALMFVKADAGRGSRGSAVGPAFERLTRALKNEPQGVLEASDLLLKWTTLHLPSNNTTVAVLVTTWLEEMFQLMAESNQNLTDNEAHAFLPHLVRRLSSSQSRFRESVMRTLELVCKCYPYSKYVPFINEGAYGLERNVYIRAETLNELARLLTRHSARSILKVKPTPGYSSIADTVLSALNGTSREIRDAGLRCVGAIQAQDPQGLDGVVALFKEYKVDLSPKFDLIKKHFPKMQEQQQPQQQQQQHQERSTRARGLSKELTPGLADAKLSSTEAGLGGGMIPKCQLRLPRGSLSTSKNNNNDNNNNSRKHEPNNRGEQNGSGPPGIVMAVGSGTGRVDTDSQWISSTAMNGERGNDVYEKENKGVTVGHNTMAMTDTNPLGNGQKDNFAGGGIISETATHDNDAARELSKDDLECIMGLESDLKVVVREHGKESSASDRAIGLLMDLDALDSDTALVRVVSDRVNVVAAVRLAMELFNVLLDAHIPNSNDTSNANVGDPLSTHSVVWGVFQALRGLVRHALLRAVVPNDDVVSLVGSFASINRELRLLLVGLKGPPRLTIRRSANDMLAQVSAVIECLQDRPAWLAGMFSSLEELVVKFSACQRVTETDGEDSDVREENKKRMRAIDDVIAGFTNMLLDFLPAHKREVVDAMSDVSLALTANALDALVDALKATRDCAMGSRKAGDGDLWEVCDQFGNDLVAFGSRVVAGCGETLLASLSRKLDVGRYGTVIEPEEQQQQKVVPASDMVAGEGGGVVDLTGSSTFLRKSELMDEGPISDDVLYTRISLRLSAMPLKADNVVKVMRPFRKYYARDADQCERVLRDLKMSQKLHSLILKTLKDHQLIDQSVVDGDEAETGNNEEQQDKKDENKSPTERKATTSVYAVQLQMQQLKRMRDGLQKKGTVKVLDATKKDTSEELEKVKNTMDTLKGKMQEIMKTRRGAPTPMALE